MATSANGGRSTTRYAGPVPHYNDDIVPANRRAVNPSLMAIGDVQFVVPPSFISVNETSNVNITPALRQRNSIKSKSGYTNTEIRIDLWFVGADQVNGSEIANPEGGSYFMDGLRSLVAQFKRSPILPIANTYLNDVHQIHSVVLVNLQVNTVPGFPNTLKATLVLHKTTVEPYLMRPDEEFGDMICWPVFRWYYQQMMTNGPTISQTRLRPIASGTMRGDFRFFVMDEGILGNKIEPKDVPAAATAQMIEVPLGANAIIEDMSISLGNQVTPLQTQLNKTPTHQYLASVDTTLLLRMQCDDAALTELVSLKHTTEEYSLKYRDRVVSGFLRFENEMCQLFGVEHVMIQGLESSTIEGMPGWNSVNLILVSFDRTQKRDERPDQLTYAQGTFDDLETMFDGDLSHIDHTLLVERMMNGLELYPDLELPTYGELERAVKKMNQQRAKAGLTQMEYSIKPPDPAVYQQTQGVTFVDPDFYMSYTGLLPGGFLYHEMMQQALDRTTYQGKGAANNGKPVVSKPMTAGSSLGNRSLTLLPQDHWLYPLVAGAAQRADIDPNLVAAIIWWEHRGFDNVTQSSRSNVGAAGIMQVMPETAEAVGVPAHEAQTNPASNVLAGSLFLKDTLREFNNNLPLAIAAYNAGGGAVQEMSQMAGGSTEWDKIAEAVSAATPQYVKDDPDQFSNKWYHQTLPYVAAVMEKYGGGGNGGTGNITTVGAGGIDSNIPDWAWSAGEDQFVDLSSDPVDTNPTNEEEIIKGSFYDMMRYNRRGQLIRAFPTYCLMFVDEGPWQDGRRTWTRYFAYHSLTSIAVSKDRTNPADTCHITLTNVYGSLDHSEKLPSKYLYPEGQGSGWIDKSWSWAHSVFEEMRPEITKEMIEWRAKGVNHMAIRPGARIHLRMGYGSSAVDLPVVFNGTVAEISAEDSIDLVAQGDGIELLNVFTEVDPKASSSKLTISNEPFDIIAGVLTERSKWGRFFGDGGEQSPFGIEHFGQLKKYKLGTFEKLSGSRKRLKDWSNTGNLWWWLYNEYDLVKNVYSSNFKVYAPKEYQGWLTQHMPNAFKNATKNAARQDAAWWKWWDGEDDFEMYIGQRTPWDIFTTIAKATPDYIVSVVPYQFRSTLYFGMPQWQMKFGYAKKPGYQTKDNPDSYQERVKTFAQFHVFTSYTDILYNGIKVSSRDLVHNCAAQYSTGGDLKVGRTVFADDSIKSDQIRTDVIDTGVTQDLFALPDSLIEKLGLFTGGRDRAEQIARSHVRDSFKNMYDGELIILGEPSLKPHDYFHLADPYTDMFGTTQIGRVVHHMSAEMGFVTHVKPDLLVGLRDSPFSYFQQIVTRRLIPMGWGIVSGVTMARRLRKIAKVWTWASAIKDIGTRLWRVPQAIWRAGKAVVEVTGVIRKGVAAIRGMREAVSLTLAVAGPESFGASLVVLAAWEALWWVIDQLLDHFFFWLENSNILAIQPLWYKGMPYVAGVDGFEKIIPGMKDPRYYPDQTGQDPETKQDYKLQANFNDLLNVPELGSGPSGARTTSVPGGSAGGAPGGGGSGRFAFPVDQKETSISDGFGATAGRSNAHQGVDWASLSGKTGLPIYAVADGTLAAAFHYSDNKGYNSAWGTYLAVEHTGKNWGYKSVYAHLEKIESGLWSQYQQHDADPDRHPAPAVRKGQVIGWMGGVADVTSGVWPGTNTPSSDGPHLHFGLFHGSEAIDPVPMMDGTTGGIPPTAQDAGSGYVGPTID